MAIQTILWTDVVKTTWLTKINANFTDLESRKVNNTGAETIGGEKTFSDDVWIWRTPTSRLDVYEASAFVKCQMESWGAFDVISRVQNTVWAWTFMHDASDDVVKLLYWTWTTGINWLAINSSGNVWIGTTSPASKLEVNWAVSILSSDPWVDELLLDFRNPNYWIYATSSSVSAHWNTLDFKAVDYDWWADTVRNILNLSPSGNVWIGTTSPWAKLEIQNDWTWNWLFIDQNWNWVALWIVTDATTTAWISLYTGAIHTWTWTSSIVSLWSDSASATWWLLNVRNDWSWVSLWVSWNNTAWNLVSFYNNGIHTWTLTSATFSIWEENASSTWTVLNVRNDWSWLTLNTHWKVRLTSLPTSAAGLSTGDLWNNSWVVTII